MYNLEQVQWFPSARSRPDPTDACGQKVGSIGRMIDAGHLTGMGGWIVSVSGQGIDRAFVDRPFGHAAVLVGDCEGGIIGSDADLVDMDAILGMSGPAETAVSSLVYNRGWSVQQHTCHADDESGIVGTEGEGLDGEVNDNALNLGARGRVDDHDLAAMTAGDD
ncbi:MAG: hypothetical protein CXT64_06755 [Methanobacteriota archaeon]|nr:MAG: hypothetical protein CXT64_06755 [Euryarchaeota archaeon]